MADTGFIPDGVEIIRYSMEPTARLFHRSDAFFRGLRGPIGSGKSVDCAAEIVARGFKQQPWGGVRRTRWAVIRNTYGELRTTTIRTWLDWFGISTHIVYGHPITGIFRSPHWDRKSTVEIELIFLALDRADDIKKLKSLELTGVWLNEACELPVEVLNMATGRIDRYPGKNRGGTTWTGIIADTNPPNVNNWWYEFEMSKPDGYDFFVQPPALLIHEDRDARGRLQSVSYDPNPAAENIVNHNSGYDYYLRQVPGKPLEWVKVFIGNCFGSSRPGHIVYADYCEMNHTERRAEPAIGSLIWSHDFNFTPLSSFVAQRIGDDVYVVDEIVLSSAVAEQAALEFVERYAAFKGCLVLLYGDASGRAGEKHGHASNFITIERLLKEHGFRVDMRVPRANSSIVDGQNSLRARICDASGKRSFFVNPTTCPTLDTGLRTVKLKEGSAFQEEDSMSQHITTAARYFTAVEFPVEGRNVAYYGIFG